MKTLTWLTLLCFIAVAGCRPIGLQHRPVALAIDACSAATQPTLDRTTRNRILFARCKAAILQCESKNKADRQRCEIRLKQEQQLRLAERRKHKRQMNALLNKRCPSCLVWKVTALTALTLAVFGIGWGVYERFRPR